MLSLLIAALASAGALDNIEVGGVWGTPTTTDAPAVWWNPAGLAHDSGTRFQLQVAPTWAGLNFERSDPDFGFEPSVAYRRFGPLPHAFFATDAGVKGLGLGAGMALPFVRGATEDAATLGDTAARYSLQDANVQSMHLMASAAYSPHKVVSFGGTFHFVNAEWAAQTDSETLTGIKASLEEQDRDTSHYEDANFYHPDYSARVYFGGHNQERDATCGYGSQCRLDGALTDTAMTFSAGLRVVPIDEVAISVNYTHGYRVENTGDAHLSFQCPPQSDTWGRLGSELRELCYAQLEADAQVGYNLPSRVNFGVQVTPNEDTTVELMGAWVGWSAFTDYDITISNVAGRNPELSDPETTAASVDKSRKQARAANDSVWIGADYKQDIGKVVTVGGRVIYDPGAIPDEALLPSNFDAPTIMLSPVIAVRGGPMQFGLSATQQIVMPRTITSSNFGVTIEDDARNEDRYFYPAQTGTYRGYFTRAHIFVRGHFGGSGFDGKDPVFTVDDLPNPGAPDVITVAPADFVEARFTLAAPGNVTCGADSQDVADQTALYLNADSMPATCSVTIGDSTWTGTVEAAGSWTCEDAGDGTVCVSAKATAPPVEPGTIIPTAPISPGDLPPVGLPKAAFFCQANDKLSECTQTAESAPLFGVLGEQGLQEQCSVDGTFGPGSCPEAGAVGYCTAPNGQVRAYYVSGGKPYTAATAREHCTGLLAGEWTGPQ